MTKRSGVDAADDWCDAAGIPGPRALHRQDVEVRLRGILGEMIWLELLREAWTPRREDRDAEMRALWVRFGLEPLPADD